MQYTFPGWRYLSKASSVEKTNGEAKQRHRVLTICLLDSAEMYCYQFFVARYNPYWESTEFTLWFPEPLPFWSFGSMFPNVIRASEDALKASVGSGQFEEVTVLGRQTTKVAEEIIGMAFKHNVKIANFTAKGSQAYARVSSLTKAHLRLV